MIKLLPKKYRENAIKVCNKWLTDNLIAREIKENIGTLAWAVPGLLPELENGVYVSSQVSILIDDILEMDSITDEEKDQSILELVEKNKEELQSLAQRVIAQIEIDTQKYQEEAEERGFCRKLTEEVIERNTDKEDE